MDAFLGQHATPQAGDMFVYDANNAIQGGSHTNMVERYDAATRTIYTIGGNEGHAVGGRRVALTDRAQVRRLASMVRIGAEFYTGLTGGGAAASAPGGTAATPGQAPPAAGATGAAPQPAPASQPAQPTGAGGAAGAADSAATQIGTALVQAARDINSRIAAALQGLGQIQGNNTGATVLEWQTGSTTANATTSDN